MLSFSVSHVLICMWKHTIKIFWKKLTFRKTLALSTRFWDFSASNALFETKFINSAILFYVSTSELGDEWTVKFGESFTWASLMDLIGFNYKVTTNYSFNSTFLRRGISYFRTWMSSWKKVYHTPMWKILG